MSSVGGILTFTPTVLIRQSLRVMDVLLRLRQKHIHWTAYTPAYILGAAFVEYYGSEEKVKTVYEA